MSLAELARRGIEYMLIVYYCASEDGREWQPPTPRRLGWKGLSDAELKMQAQLTALPATPISAKKRHARR
jgi:hypothetical protein